MCIIEINTPKTLKPTASQYDLKNKNCPSCEAPLEGRFCHNCGEKKLDREEMTLRYFAGNVWSAITFTDVKFLRSVLALLFKPGKLTVEFFAGRRKLYTAPLTLFFFINLVYFIYQPVDALNSTLVSQTSGQFYSNWADGVVEGHLEKENISRADFLLEYNHMTGQVSKLFLVVFILIFAVGIALVNMERGELFYFHLISATHFVSYSILSMLIIVPFFAIIFIKIYLRFSEQDSFSLNPNMVPITLILLLGLGIYAFAMQRKLYDQNFFINLLKAVLLIVFFALSVVVYRFFLFVMTMLLV